MVHPAELTHCLSLIQEAYDAPNDVYFRLDGNILAFRGSEDISDWMTNATAIPHPYSLAVGTFSVPGGHVHKGFFDRWLAVRPKVRQALGDSRELITITGHSLGGAMAILCGLELRLQQRAVRIITFGCPRVGDAEFAAIVDYNVSQLFRYENWGDPVPWIPTYTRGWRHAGVSRGLGSVLNLLRFPQTQHHKMDAYRKAVQELR